MSTHDEELDRYLDGLARGSGGDPASLDPATVQTARVLCERAAWIRPSTGFVNRLERSLVNGVDPVRTAAAVTHSGTTRTGRSSRAWFGRALGAAALAAVVAITMVVIYKSGPDESNFAVASVSASPDNYPTKAECTRDPEAGPTVRAAIDSTFGPPLLASIPMVLRPVPASNLPDFPFIPESAVPTGTEPSDAVRAEVTTALRRDIACITFGLRVTNPDPSPSALATPAVDVHGYVSAIWESIQQSPRMARFANGEVGVFLPLPADVYGTDVEGCYVFVSYGGDWLGVDFGLAAPDLLLASTYRGPISRQSIVINLNDVHQPSQELAIPTTDQVRVTVINHGAKSHTLTFPGRAVQYTLGPGAEQDIYLHATTHATGFALGSDEWGQSLGGGYIWLVGSAGTPTAAATP